MNTSWHFPWHFKKDTWDLHFSANCVYGSQYSVAFRVCHFYDIQRGWDKIESPRKSKLYIKVFGHDRNVQMQLSCSSQWIYKDQIYYQININACPPPIILCGYKNFVTLKSVFQKWLCYIKKKWCSFMCWIWFSFTLATLHNHIHHGIQQGCTVLIISNAQWLRGFTVASLDKGGHFSTVHIIPNLTYLLQETNKKFIN